MDRPRSAQALPPEATTRGDGKCRLGRSCRDHTKYILKQTSCRTEGGERDAGRVTHMAAMMMANRYFRAFVVQDGWTHSLSEGHKILVCVLQADASPLAQHNPFILDSDRDWVQPFLQTMAVTSFKGKSEPSFFMLWRGPQQVFFFFFFFLFLLQRHGLLWSKGPLEGTICKTWQCNCECKREPSRNHGNK